MNRIAFAALAFAFALPAIAPPSYAQQPLASPRLDGDFTLFVGGDLLGPYRTSLDKIPPAFAQVAALIQQSDAAFANQEGSSFDLSSFKGATAAENGGGYPIHTLDTMRNLHAMGINLLSRANNHSTDWGLEGLTATDVAVNAIGFTHAGTGQSLDAARAPGILNTSKGAVALVATASTFPGMSPAGDPDRGAGARPGLNPLHVEPVTLVTTDEMQALGKIVVRGGYQGYDLPGATPKEVHLNEKLFRVSATPGLTFDVSDKDRAALLASVSTARARAGLVLFSIHAHETRSGGYEDSDPAEFLPTLFHDAIDKGASVVLRHGPHAIQGIEIYKGTPIFYGLGHLFFELPKTITIASEGPHKQTVTLPEKWWEATAATLHYKQGKLQQIRIYPLIINDRDGPEQGLPTLAKGVQAQAILKRIQERSQPYHTQIRISDDIAIIDQF